MARAGFLVLAAVLAWLSLWPRRRELSAALNQIDALGLWLGCLLVVLGLLATGQLWRRLLAAFGYRLSASAALAIFFGGQVGKYLPGSVWSIAAQAESARRAGVPIRTTSATSLLFLILNVLTAVAVGAGAASWLDSPGLPRWAWLLLGVMAAASLAPQAVNRMAARLAGQSAPGLSGRTVAEAIGWLALAWASYAGACVLWAPGQDLTWLGALAAYSLAYAAGVVMILAPAGLGAREVTFVALVAPMLGVSGGIALALVARVVHTGADFLLAAGAGALSRFDRAPAGDVK